MIFVFFRAINLERVLHYDPIKCGRIIVACTVLHNLCILRNIPGYVPYDEGGLSNVFARQDAVALRAGEVLHQGRENKGHCNKGVIFEVLSSSHLVQYFTNIIFFMLVLN